jgi:predicted DNA-binding transcriptional regulator AlpA
MSKTKSAMLSRSAATLVPVAADVPPRLERFLTLQDVKLVTRQSRTVIYRKMGLGQFPKNLRLETRPGARRAIAVWVESEIIGWQQEQIANRDGRSIAPPAVASTKARKEKANELSNERAAAT